MNSKRFESYRRAMAVVVGFMVALAVFIGDLTLAILVVTIGIIVLYSIRSKVKQPIEDERNFRISEKASRRTIQVYGAATAMLGLALVVLSRGGYLEMADLGYSLAYFALGLLLVYSVFYNYYAKKFGE